MVYQWYHLLWAMDGPRCARIYTSNPSATEATMCATRGEEVGVIPTSAENVLRRAKMRRVTKSLDEPRNLKKKLKSRKLKKLKLKLT